MSSHGGHLDGSAIHSDSDSDDGVIEIRPSSYRHSNLAQNAKRKPPFRSKSVSSSSSTTTSSASTRSNDAPVRQRRKSASAGDSKSPSQFPSVPPTSAYRPRPPHPSHADPSYRDRVTIAPIPPTLLKTTGAWEEGFGDECGASDDCLWDFVSPQYGADGKLNNKYRQGGGRRREEEAGSDGTPVELVYVPPLGSVYGYSATTYWRNRNAIVDDDDEDDGDGEAIKVEDEDESDAQSITKGDNETTEENSPSLDEHRPNQDSSSPPPESTQPVASSPIPVVVVEPDTDFPYPQSSAPADSSSNSPGASSGITIPVPVPSRDRYLSEDGQGQDRGRSISVSPISLQAPGKPHTSTANGTLTSRGRTQSYQDLQSFRGDSPLGVPSQAGEWRGRLTSRVSSASSLRGHSSRSCQSSSGGRSGESGSLSPNVHSSSSPMCGSLSPDPNDARLGGIGSVYAGGRMSGRERERLERVGSNSSLSSRGTASGNDGRRGRDRGRRNIGSGSGSGSGSSVSPIADAMSPPQGIESATTSAASSFDSRGADIDASICSASSEGSTATIVPIIPTPLPHSFSKHERTASTSSTHSQTTPSKSRIKSPPPIVPTPPYPSFPSTSPSYAPGEVSPSIVFAGFGDLRRRSISSSLERTSSGSRDRTSSPPSSPLGAGIIAEIEHERELAESRRGRNGSTAGSTWGVVSSTSTSKSGDTQPEFVIGGLKERDKETILNKAVGMVSTAGAYLRFWPSAGASQ